METLSIRIPPSTLQALRARAQELGVSVETLVYIGVQDLLSAPNEEVKLVAERLLSKNRELYERLR